MIMMMMVKPVLETILHVVQITASKHWVKNETNKFGDNFEQHKTKKDGTLYQFTEALSVCLSSHDSEKSYKN